MRAPRSGEGAAILTGAWSAYQLGLGAYFALLRPPLLPEDTRFIGSEAADAGLASWLDLVFLVMGGQMAAVGVLGAALALRLRGGVQAADLAALAMAGLLSVLVMSLVNFRLESDFRSMLVAPVLVWAGAVAAALSARRRRAEEA